MAGEYVPLVMIPRFTSYIGAAEYVTVALDVSAFYKFDIAFWCGPLVGDDGTGASLSATFETSDDNDTWTEVPEIPAITTPNGHTIGNGLLRPRWLRVKIVLTEDADHVVAITCWAAGQLERRQSA